MGKDTILLNCYGRDERVLYTFLEIRKMRPARNRTSPVVMMTEATVE